MDNTAKPLCHKCSKTITVKGLRCATCERYFHPNCLQKYAAVKDARSCCSAAYTAMRYQLAARRKSDRQALDRSLSRANIFDSARSISHSINNFIDHPLPVTLAPGPTILSQQQVILSSTPSSSLTVEEQVNRFQTLALEQKLCTLYREILTQTSDFKVQFKQLADSVDNHEDTLTSLELGRADDQVRFEEKLAITQQVIVYSQHQKSLAEVIIGGLPVETSLLELKITQR